MPLGRGVGNVTASPLSILLIIELALWDANQNRTSMELPDQNNLELHISILEIIERRGGIAITEDILEEVRLSDYPHIPRGFKKFNERIRFALIEMEDGTGARKGKGKHWLECPFGSYESGDKKGRKKWLLENRPTCGNKRQQIYKITDLGRRQIEANSSNLLIQESGLLPQEIESIKENYSFNPSSLEDARKRTFRAIVERQGQKDFRSRLIRTYKICLITGCNFIPALEAAHIIPYKGLDTNHLANGLLLRADIHTLFDLGLIAIDSTSMTVITYYELLRTSYASLHGQPLLIEEENLGIISKEALDIHRNFSGL